MKLSILLLLASLAFGQGVESLIWNYSPSIPIYIEDVEPPTPQFKLDSVLAHGKRRTILGFDSAYCIDKPHHDWLTSDTVRQGYSKKGDFAGRKSYAICDVLNCEQCPRKMFYQICSTCGRHELWRQVIPPPKPKELTNQKRYESEVKKWQK